jgi:hypothetical protein
MTQVNQNVPYNPFVSNQVQYINPQQIQYSQGLTPQEIAEIKKNGNGQTMQITKEQMIKARCTHREGNQTRLVPTNNPDAPNEVRCTLCGDVFNLLQGVTPQDVANHVADTHDLLSTIKVMYLDLPPKLINEIFQIMPVMDNMKDLYSIAADRASMYYDSQHTWAGYNNTIPNGMNMYNAILAGQAQPMYPPYQQQMPYANVPPQGAPQQPFYGQPPVAPQGYPQQPPMQQPPFQQPPMQQYGQPYPMYGQAPMTMQQQQMTAAAPGLTNGFGVTEPPAQAAQPVGEKPTTTKALQA